MSEQEQAAARDATSWAKSVSQLNVSEVPEGALNLNVEGRRLASPIQGFGKMWQKTYQVRLPRRTRLGPRGDRDLEGALPGLLAGGQPLLRAAHRNRARRRGAAQHGLPGKMKLSTGVMVLYADEESFTLMTPEGHMFAGWITFSATAVGDDTVAQAQVLMRAQRPDLRARADAWAATSRRTASGSTR